MSRIRRGRIEILDGPAGTCCFCGEKVSLGAFWMGATGPLCLCFACASEGKLGKLLGDAGRDMDDVARMLDRTAREAWRALAAAHGRDRREPDTPT